MPVKNYGIVAKLASYGRCLPSVQRQHKEEILKLWKELVYGKRMGKYTREDVHTALQGLVLFSEMCYDFI